MTGTGTINSGRFLLFTLIFLAVAVRLFFWIYTGRTWEDALITVQHAENAARGLGLTHTPSDEPPLHGFTSPLSVLVPLVGELLHPGFGLALIKLVSALLGGAAVFLGFQICSHLKLPPVLALTVAAYLAFEHHQILWGMAGMETQIAVVSYLYSFRCFQRGTQLQKGISLGLCLLARPDAVLWVGIACCFELWRTSKLRDFKLLVPLMTGLICVYGPWLIFTFAYYGSPIPNTIYAKALGYPGFWTEFKATWNKPYFSIGAGIISVIGHCLAPFSTLGPAYAGNGHGFEPLWDQHRIIAVLMALLSVPGALAAFIRRDESALMIYAFIAAYFSYFTSLVPFLFGWYAAPFTAAAVIGSTYGLWYLISLVPKPSLRSIAATVFGAGYIGLILFTMPVTMRAEKHVQQYVEMENRRAIGLYIRGLAKSGDTIGCEPLGYIGYYSRLPVYDYPGLCNRRVVQFLRDHPEQRGLASMLEYFHPTFLVLRPAERQSRRHVPFPWLARDYSLIHVFRVPPEKTAQLLFAKENVDLEFDVFERNQAPITRSNEKGGSNEPPKEKEE